MRKYLVPALVGVMAVGALVSNGGLERAARAQDAAPPARQFQLEGNELKVPSPVLFETGSDTIKPESAEALNYVKDYLEAKSYISLMRIENHTDNVGDEKKNVELSSRRALAVAKALVAKGVDCKRLLPVGFGSYKPIAANDTPENKAKNRRTSFVNAALKGRPIGGMPVDGSAPTAPGDACK